MVFLHDSELSADMMEDAEENAGLTLQEMSGRVEELEKQLEELESQIKAVEKDTAEISAEDGKAIQENREFMIRNRFDVYVKGE